MTPPEPPPARPLLLVAVALLVAAGAASARTLQGCTNPVELFNRVLLSSDELFPEALYADLVTGACDVRAFQFSAATFAFPDVAAYAGVRAAAGSGRRAILPWAAAFYLLLVAAAVVAARAAVPPARRRPATALVLVAAAGYLGMNCLARFEHRQLGEFYLPLYHAGAVAAVLVGLALVAGMCRRPGGWRSWRGPALLVLAALATFSDRLFAVWLPAPLVAAAFVTRVLRGRGPAPAVSPWPGLAVAVFVLGGGAAAGLAGLRWLQGPGDPIENYWSEALVEDAARRLKQLAAAVWAEARGGNPVLIATLGWLVLCAGTLAARAGQVVRRRETDAGSPVGTDGFVFLAAFTLVTTALNTIVYCASKTANLLDVHPWEESSRYFLLPQALGWFGWAAWAAHFTGDRSRRVRAAAAWVPVGVVGVLLVAAAARVEPRARDVLDTYPEDVEQLDRACAARGLTCGLADYGTAKRATVLSRTGLVVRQVAGGAAGDKPLHGYHWLSNAQWYWRRPDGRPGPVRYEFVVTFDESTHPWRILTDRVTAAYGPPAERVRVGAATLLVYNRPADAGVRDFGEDDPGVRGLREKFDPGR